MEADIDAEGLALGSRGDEGLARRLKALACTAPLHDLELPPLLRSARYLVPVGSRVLLGWSGGLMLASVQAVSYSSGLR